MRRGELGGGDSSIPFSFNTCFATFSADGVSTTTDRSELRIADKGLPISRAVKARDRRWVRKGQITGDERCHFAGI